MIDNTSGTGTYTLTVGNNNAGGTFAGTIQNSSGSVALAKIGSGCAVVDRRKQLRRRNVDRRRYAAIGGAGSLGGGLYAAAVANSGALLMNTSVNQTFSGDISGPGSSCPGRAGNGVLSASNSYSGGTVDRAPAAS